MAETRINYWKETKKGLGLVLKTVVDLNFKVTLQINYLGKKDRSDKMLIFDLLLIDFYLKIRSINIAFSHLLITWLIRCK